MTLLVAVTGALPWAADGSERLGLREVGRQRAAGGEDEGTDEGEDEDESVGEAKSGQRPAVLVR